MQLNGKTILLVNAGSPSKQFILHKIKALGVSIICVDHEVKEFAEEYVDTWIIYKNESDLLAILDLSFKKEKIDGIITFWEDDVLLTSKLVSRYKRIGHSMATVKNVRNKLNFRKIVNTKLDAINRFSFQINTTNIEQYADIITYPCIVKPIYGASSCFVTYVSNKDELLHYVKIIENNISTEIESALSNGLEILVENYLPGDEIDIDVLIQKGEIRHYSITDNLPALKPYMMEVGQSIPSKYQQNIYDKIKISAQVKDFLDVFGIENGCLHFEAKYHEGVLYPIEINLRMGGDEVYFFVKECFGVDLIENAVKIALGIEISLGECHSENFLYGEYIIPEKPGVLKKFTADERVFYKIVQSKKIGEVVNIPPKGFDFLGWFIIKGENEADCYDKISIAKGAVTVQID